jgi:hypothetical protein
MPFDIKDSSNAYSIHYNPFFMTGGDMSRNTITRVLYLLLLLMITYIAYSVTVAPPGGAGAQNSKGSEKDKAQKESEETTKDKYKNKSFMQFRGEREFLDTKMDALQKDLDLYWYQQWYLMEEAKYKRDLSLHKKDTKEWTELQKRINESRSYAGTTDTLEGVNKKVEDAKTNLSNLKRRKLEVETEMNRLIDIEQPKQEFKKLISLNFTMLIALVILGFFFIAWRDQTVRCAIFAGQEGIQFVTLFSLVIAIILFGVLGILEGKELAALLGGLSGYILGRTTSHSPGASMANTSASSPAITAISPSDATVGTTQSPIPVQISGSALQLANSVKIVQGANELLVANIVSNEGVIKCNVTLNPNQPKGVYDVIVTNSDGAVARLPQAFTVK